MNHNQVIDSKIVHVYKQLNGINEFNFFINLEFEPTHMIIRAVSFYNMDNDLSDNMLLIKSSIVDNKVMFHFPATDVASGFFNVKIPFKLNKKPINGIHTFQLTTIDDDLSSNIDTFDMHLTFILEFVQYKNLTGKRK